MVHRLFNVSCVHTSSPIVCDDFNCMCDYYNLEDCFPIDHKTVHGTDISKKKPTSTADSSGCNLRCFNLG